MFIVLPMQITPTRPNTESATRAGGGRSSARETIARCVAGAIAKLVLRQKGIRIQAFTSQVGNIKLNGSYTDYDLDKAEETAVRCPDPATPKKWRL